LFQKIGVLLSTQPDLQKRVLFYREDEAPIKKIMGRSRAQVFIKLLEHKDSQAVLAALQEMANGDWPCEVTLEVNPASMA